jgi:type IV pilus assembly protein PilA
MNEHKSERGFTLVELMVVVLVIAILIAIAIPTFLGARTRAQDRTAQANLVTASKAESAYAATTDGFTDAVAVLTAEEPGLDWTGADDEDIHVVVADVAPGDNRQVLLYSRSNSGTWFGLRIARASGGGVVVGRYTCAGAAEADVDEMGDCMGTDW